MIQKVLLCIGIILCGLCRVCAQDASITGKIENESGHPLAGATLFLYRGFDNFIMKSAVSDKLGIYEINSVNFGNYFIEASCIGYAKKTTPIFTLKPGDKLTASLILKITEKELAEVKLLIIHEKPIIEVNADKTVFNIESNINATGSNAFELLQKSPGVQVDKDGNISMKGKNGVRVYIDGRATQMDAADLAVYLKSINSGNIESIEMISNPSAIYDASGNAGIINLKLKKNNTIGFNASLAASLNIGNHLSTSNSLNLNYRNKKVNIFGNYSYTWSNNDNTFLFHRIQNDTLYNQNNFENIKGNVNNIKAGTDFFTSKKSTIGFIYTGNFMNDNTYSYSRTPSSAVNTGIESKVLYAKNMIPACIKNQNINLNYRYLDTTGYEINIDLDHGFYQNHKTSYQPNSYYTASPEIFLSENDFKNYTPVNININTLKIDYTVPLKDGKLSMGAKFSQVNTNNIFNLYNVINGQDQQDFSNSNIFLYNEKIIAAYGNYNKKLNTQFKIQLGLRIENTISQSTLNAMAEQTPPLENNTIKRNYTDFFPNATFSYLLNPDNNFDLSINRRIDRPNYSDLNPFETRVDELTYIKGNAYLRPQYTNNIQLSHSFKSKIITALSYSHVADFSTYITDTINVTSTYVTKKNLASEDIISLNISTPLDVAKWWNVFLSANFFNNSYHANLGMGNLVNINITSVSFGAINTFKLNNKITAELSAYYQSPYIALGTFKTKKSLSMDIGVQKSILQDNATIKISCSDVWRTLKWKGESNYSGAQIVATSTWESRQLRISISHRLGRTQVKQARQHNSGNSDEKQRITATGNSIN